MSELNCYTINYLKRLRVGKTRLDPAQVSLLPATWRKYREDLEAIVKNHPRFSLGILARSIMITPDLASYRKGTYVDHWHCVWENVEGAWRGWWWDIPC